MDKDKKIAGVSVLDLEKEIDGFKVHDDTNGENPSFGDHYIRVNNQHNMITFTMGADGADVRTIIKTCAEMVAGNDPAVEKLNEALGFIDARTPDSPETPPVSRSGKSDEK